MSERCPWRSRRRLQVEFQPWYLHPAHDGGEEREEREGERERLKDIVPGSTLQDLVASGYDTMMMSFGNVED